MIHWPARRCTVRQTEPSGSALYSARAHDSCRENGVNCGPGLSAKFGSLSPLLGEEGFQTNLKWHSFFPYTSRSKCLASRICQLTKLPSKHAQLFMLGSLFRAGGCVVRGEGKSLYGIKYPFGNCMYRHGCTPRFALPIFSVMYTAKYLAFLWTLVLPPKQPSLP